MKYILKTLLICIIFFYSAPLFAKETTWVSIMRSDGIMIPLALFKNGNWVNSWPETGSADASLNIEKLSDIPKEWLSNSLVIPNKWFLNDNKGIKHALDALKPVKYGAHCEGNWGLLTNYPTPVESEYATIPKIGIASNTDSKIYAAVIISSESQNKEVVSIIEQEFKIAEIKAIQKEINKGPDERNILPFTGHPIDPKTRDKTPITISEMYQIKHTGDLYYFFIATRTYSKPRGCEALSLFNGVVTHKKGDSYKLHKRRFYLDGCDWKVGYSIPLGIIAVQNNYYLIQENIGYESEWYTIDIIDNNKFKEVFILSGGGC